MFCHRLSAPPALSQTLSRGRHIATFPVLTLLTVVGLLAGVPAAAADTTPAPTSSPSASTDQGDHAMGSTIRAHESSPGSSPGSATPFTAPAGVPGMDV